MNRALEQLGVAAAFTLAIWLLSGRHWTDAVIGAILALSLWVIVFAGSYATPRRGDVATSTYALAAVVSLVLGYVVVRVGDGDPAWWAVGVIMGGILTPTVAGLARADSGT